MCNCEELADEAILKRIQHVLTEWRQKQLRIQLQEPAEIIPQFTFHFPEDRNQNYQSDYFAVPPSDPRYYQQQPGRQHVQSKHDIAACSFQLLSSLKYTVGYTGCL